ncbi:MAG: hypothetical protein DRN25_06525, partial [Thermoplasmata archaeon]
SSLLPPEATNIVVYKDNVSIASYEDRNHVNIELKDIGKRFVAYHNSSLHYHNVTLEIPMENKNNVTINGKGDFILKSGKLRWFIPELSNADVTLRKKVKLEQGSAVIGKPVRWTMRVENYTIMYFTPPPSKSEMVEKNDRDVYLKHIEVSSNSSLVYRNVSISTNIPEVRYDFQVSLMEGNKKINFELVDRNRNGLYDAIEWTISELAKDSYGVKVDFSRVKPVSPNMDVINYGNSTYRAFVYSRNKNYYDEDLGGYKAIDGYIYKSHRDGFEYENTKNNFFTYFSKSGGVMVKREDLSFSFHPIDGSENPDIVVRENTITYLDIYKNISLRYRLSDSGLFEELVVHRAGIVQEFGEEFVIDGGYCKLLGDGSIQIYDKDGVKLFTIPRPSMWEERNESNVCFGLHYELESLSNGKFSIRKVIDEEGREWLNNASRNYPVVIDDTFYANTNDGYIYKSGSSWSAVHDATSGDGVDDNDQYSHVGISAYRSNIEGEYGIYRSHFRFDTSSIPDNAEITGASLHIYGYGYGESSVCAMRSTAWLENPFLTTNDFDAFTGSEYGHTSSWSTSGYNTITFNDQGKSDINKECYTRICCREYDHYYQNVAPSGKNPYCRNGLYYADYTGTTRDPYLEVTYTSNSPPSASYYGGACNIFAGKKVTTIQTEHTDPDGQSDVDDCRITVGIPIVQHCFTLNWNVDTNSYSIVDGSNYVSIDGCTVTETSITNGYRLTWQFIVDWDFELDDQDYDVAAWTDDESGANSGYQWDEAGNYTFENDLEVTIFNVAIYNAYDDDHDGSIDDDEWFAGGHEITASGIVEYEGSSQTFDSKYASSVQVQLFYDTDGDGAPDDLEDTYADTSIDNGEFSITYTPGTSPALQPNAHFDVAIQGIPTGGSDVTQDSIEITSRRDNEAPSAPSNPQCRPDSYTDTGEYDDDTTIYFTWINADDG